MSETRMMLLDRLRRGAKTLRFFHVDEPCDWDAVTKDDAVLHIPKEWLDLPLIGPAHAPVVLDGVTVEELAEWANDYHDDHGMIEVIPTLLTRIGIAIPEGYGTVQRATDEYQEPVITITCHDGYVPRNGGSIAFLALRKKEA